MAFFHLVCLSGLVCSQTQDWKHLGTFGHITKTATPARAQELGPDLIMAGREPNAGNAGASSWGGECSGKPVQGVP